MILLLNKITLFRAVCGLLCNELKSFIFFVISAKELFNSNNIFFLHLFNKRFSSSFIFLFLYVIDCTREVIIFIYLKDSIKLIYEFALLPYFLKVSFFSLLIISISSSLLFTWAGNIT